MTTKLTQLFVDFFESKQSSGIILIVCTITSIMIANSSWGKGYSDFWHTKIGFEVGSISLQYSLEHWINDGLMAIFFLLIGLEIERQLYIGELSDLKNATLPVFAAIGGMVTPAVIHFLLNRGSETQAGFGIPMATDIAFALGVLAILGNRVPLSLTVFLTALAIIDDLGAIVVIALFYVGDFSVLNFISALSIFIGLLVLNRLGVNRLLFYLIPGIFLWYFMLKSGIHATISGVLLAFAVPFRRNNAKSPSYKLQHLLHKPVAFIIMPLFALANTGIELKGAWIEGLASSNSLGIIAGLFFGKSLGIALFSVLAVNFGLSRLPTETHWKHIVGAGFLGGIGFTMSIFISFLAFGDPELVQSSKISILIGSLASGTVGFLLLRCRETKQPIEEPILPVPTTIDAILQKLIRFRDDRNWKPYHTPKNLSQAVSIEAAELQEIFLWKTDEESVQLTPEEIEQVREELADIFIYLQYLCDQFNIDLLRAVEDKIEKNAQKYPIEPSDGSSR